MANEADLVMVDGRIYTVDAARSWARAVAVRDGEIAAVGSDDDIRELIGSHTQVMDLRGRMMVPGFQDAHAHTSGGGLERIRCDLTELHDREAYLGQIRRCAEAHPEAPWVLGAGWALDVFPGGIATREDLDRIVPDRPVFLFNRDHHAAWVNSKTLEIATIDAETPDPLDGRIERDGSGMPLGTLQEGAIDLVARLVPGPTVEEMVAGILEGQRHMLSLGVTAWQEASVGDDPVSPDCFDAYLAVDGDGSLICRVVGALWWERDRGDEQIDKILERRERAGSQGRFRATSVKIMQDGVCENHTASMLTPYLDAEGRETSVSGHSFFPPEELKRHASLIDREGFQLHFHAIGDRAVREALDAIEAARDANGWNDHRHHIAHIQVIHPDDLPRFRDLGVVANGQPLWACNEPQMTELTIPFLGPERSAWQYPFGSLHRLGATLCFGSDWPVSSPDPLAEMHVAVNRTEPPDHLYGGGQMGDEPLLPEERIDLGTAIAAFTMGSAYANHLDRITGSIEVGKRADLAVLDRNPFAGPAGEIGETRVDLTMVDGAVVFDRGTLA